MLAKLEAAFLTAFLIFVFMMAIPLFITYMIYGFLVNSIERRYK